MQLNTHTVLLYLGLAAEVQGRQLTLATSELSHLCSSFAASWNFCILTSFAYVIWWCRCLDKAGYHGQGHQRFESAQE